MTHSNEIDAGTCEHCNEAITHDAEQANRGIPSWYDSIPVPEGHVWWDHSFCEKSPDKNHHPRVTSPADGGSDA